MIGFGSSLAYMADEVRAERRDKSAWRRRSERRLRVDAIAPGLSGDPVAAEGLGAKHYAAGGIYSLYDRFGARCRQ